ncbi:MAG TPA: 1-acyl-sn-glycerol-3-phosphate acyltransferase [Vicinamibacterales bacterium]
MIARSSGKSIDPEEIEAHYRRSTFVKEICVMAMPDTADGDHLFAIVVPDSSALRAKKIVNAGDLIRFEMEGLTAALTPDRRVAAYGIWFEPLPRDASGAIARDEVRRRAGESRTRELTEADRAWMAAPHASAVVETITARLSNGASLHPDANLELDLGFDSMARVELVTELEHRCGAKLSPDTHAEIFTVRQLVNALAEPAPGASSRVERIRPWESLLRDLPPDTDPVLSGLLAKRPIAAPLMHFTARVIRALLFRVELSGLEHLPKSGACIITPNHQSYLDPFMLCPMVPFGVYRKFFFVGAVEYFETPLAKWFARIANLVPVDPDSNLVPAMQAAAFGLSHGKVLVLFPEGERSIDGSVKKFKKGAPILAQHLRVPIVPVAIKGVYELWPRGGGFNWRLLRPWSRHRVRIAIGEPMTIADGADCGESAAGLRERVKCMWEVLP